MHNNGLIHTSSTSGNVSRMGAYVGIQQMEYNGMSAPYMSNIGPYSATSGPFSVAAGRLSFTYGLKGPSVSVFTHGGHTGIQLGIVFNAYAS